MHKDRKIRVAVVGAGPRGTSVLERLISRWEALPAADRPRLDLHLVDPETPGPGHVWRPEQSRLFLMNTPSLFPTVVPVGASAEGLAPSVVGLSFDDWRVLMTAATTNAQTAATATEAQAPDRGLARTSALSEADYAELSTLGSADFPSRALYGRYLEWIHQQLADRCNSDYLSVTHHATEAQAMIAREGGYLLSLADGTELAVHDVVLALGHLPAQLSAEQVSLRDGAARYGLSYWPPAVPAVVDWGILPAKEPVLVRGLGLNFFDAMIQLTEGRGGRFRRAADGGMTYQPSGREPQFFAASRRGVPYRAKAQLDSYLPRSVTLRYCTVEALRSFSVQGILPGFDHDLWPLLHQFTPCFHLIALWSLLFHIFHFGP